MQSLRDRIIKIGVIILALALAFGTGGVYAQIAGSPQSSDADEAPASLPAGSFGWDDEPQGRTTRPESSGETAFSDSGLPPAGASDQQITSPSADGSPNAAENSTASALPESYLFVPGTAFAGKSSNMTYMYDVKGCIHRTSSLSSEQYTAPVYLPNGSVIKYMRLYYVDTSATAAAGGWLSRYNPGVASADLIALTNGAVSSGAGSVLSKEITETVDTLTYAYALNVFMGSADSTVQVCGARVAYIPPFYALQYLPFVSKKP